ncbi:MAG: GNAT family N-acetyltransferase [Alphaproteobacteria bacterium]|nr:GNAT family N-acetyltransferase [Alphaproteobacteria bacterium]
MQMLNKLELPEYIETETCYAVRRKHEHNTEMLEAIDKNRVFLREFLFWVDKTKSIDDVKNATNMFIASWNNGENYAYAIFNKDNKLIGSIDLHEINSFDRNGEFGYWLAPEENGKGHISRLLQKIEKMAFEKGLVRIYIRCDVANLPSNRVCKRNGYVFEGCLKKALNTYGEFHDCNLYAKTI